MLKDLADGVPGTRHVVVLTGDGLRMAQYTTDDDTADRVAAASAGLQCLAGAVAGEFSGGDRRIRLLVIEAGGGFYYLMAAGAGAYLAVLADHDVDPGLMGRRMRDLVARIGEHLSAPPRTEEPAPGGPGGQSGPGGSTIGGPTAHGMVPGSAVAQGLVAT